MFKYLFFDDQRLFARENLVRKYGTPELIEDAFYRDPNVDMNLSGSCVFKCPDGKYHMIYHGIGDDTNAGGIGNVACDATGKRKRRAFVCAAVSDDGIHFTPRMTGADSCAGTPEFPNSVSDATWDLGELGCVVEDRKAPAEERYKALMVTSFKDDEFRHRDYLMASPDLIRWHKMPGTWHQVGTEPIVSCFYNKCYDNFTIICRPDCGERRVGYAETSDFKTFTAPLHCLQVDSLDQPLDELYGMPAFEYDNWYIGFPYLYGGQPQKNWWKGAEGTMHCELAYSLNGKNFQRSLRTPFICGWDQQTIDKFGKVCPIVWPNWMLRKEDGSILVYAQIIPKDHGWLMKSTGESALAVYRLREDGFICLASERDKTARLATRENIWHGGELTVNIRCSAPATVAVLRPDVQAQTCRPIEGFSHEDCAAFCGDNCRWVPEWKGGKLDSLKGRNLVFEICFGGGELYSLSGDCTPVMFVEARKHELFGTLPTRKGW